MRTAPIAALALAAIVVGGCITVSAEPTPTLRPTELPMITPAPSRPPSAAPTEIGTPAPTDAPTPSLAPGQTPLPTALDLLPFLTSGVSLYNVGDSTLYVNVTGINADTDEEFALLELAIEPEQITRHAALPLLLRFDFTFDQGVIDGLASCTLTVESEEEIEFVAAPNGVVVVKNGVQPDDLAEMNVAASSLCGNGAPQ